MTAPVPDFDVLLSELQLVREKGLSSLRRLQLPALHQAAAALGLTATQQQPEPSAIEELLAMAVKRIGGDDQKEAEYTFGLVPGTKLKPVGWRRERARAFRGVSAEAYRKGREQVIVEQTAEELRALVRNAALHREKMSAIASGSGQQLAEDPDQHGGVREVAATSSQNRMADPTPTPTATIERSPAPPRSPKRAGRGRVLAPLLGAGLVVLTVVAGAIILTHHDDATPAPTPSPTASPTMEPTWNGMTAAQLEQRYDKKLPQGQNGQESHCSDPPKSQPVDGASVPPVFGPDGTMVARLHLRKSPICPTVVWARVVWNDDENATFTIPPGWTLHVVMNRPDTKTMVDETEPQHGSTIHYAYGRMLTSARGCVYAAAYFTKGDAPPPTEVVPTSCIPASAL